MTFFHEAYLKVSNNMNGEPFQLLEVGAGPTMCQLLSASKYASSITFTDLLTKNVEYVKNRSSEALKENIGSVKEWGVFSDYVSKMEQAPTTAEPLLRLCRKIKDFSALNLDNPTQVYINKSFDVLAGNFVFECSEHWQEHLKNGMYSNIPIYTYVCVCTHPD